MKVLFFQHPPYCKEHGEKAGAPADEVGHRLCQEDAADAKAGYRGEPQSQRYDDDGLSQKGEEHRLPGQPRATKVDWPANCRAIMKMPKK